MEAGEVRRWLLRLRHDLVKQAAWRARDLRDLGVAPSAEDAAALRRGVLELRDLDGREATATAVWRQHREELEALPGAASLAKEPLDAFAAVVAALEKTALATGRTPEGAGILMRAVLPLEAAFDELARALGGT